MYSSLLIWTHIHVYKCIHVAITFGSNMLMKVLEEVDSSALPAAVLYVWELTEGSKSC